MGQVSTSVVMMMMIEFILSNLLAFAIVPIVIYLVTLAFNVGDMTDEHHRVVKRNKDDVFNRTRVAMRQNFKTVCHNCEKVVTTTLTEGSVQVGETGRYVNIPHYTCDECGNMVAIPAGVVVSLEEN